MSIRPPNIAGAAFAEAAEGDGRLDERARLELSFRLGAPDSWVWPRQVHGTTVLEATRPGFLGEADAAFTRSPDLTLAVATADCLPVILHGEGGTGIAHAGWRGAAAGVVVALRAAMEAAGVEVRRAAIGPGIGPCCFEVGPEVVERFPGYEATTTWGTPSVDLVAAVAASLTGVAVTASGLCTRTDQRFHSHRRNLTQHRQVSLTWLQD